MAAGKQGGGLQIRCDDKTGRVCSVRLFGRELLDVSLCGESEFLVNGRPLSLRRRYAKAAGGEWWRVSLKGEHWVDHFSGWGLVVTRSMGSRPYGKFPCVGVHYTVRRENADPESLLCPGPGGPPVEAPLYVDSFTVPAWKWRFWGPETRMIFHSAHSSGPFGEGGHAGFENDTPEECKKYLTNVWRRLYPGVMTIHGGVFYNVKTGHWLAITCRRPGVGYILNIQDAGRGVAYDFTLHAAFGLGEQLTLPEIKMYYGRTSEEMWTWMADYVTEYYQEPPAWVFRTLWGEGLAWNNEPTWSRQAEAWEKRLKSGAASGIGWCLVTNRPVRSGTTPLGYEPDPNHGPIEEFVAMCRRITGRGVPLLIWMSHSGLMYRGGPEIDDDWFIRGVDGRICASWGDADYPDLAHINPGHPGYIEYTKRWIRFYMKECGARGIFFDCLGWAFPPDFRPRSFMRYPGDTNRMVIRFMEEAYRCIKECDPEGIMAGEGSTFDAPVNILTVNFNPRRKGNPWGPRDFLLQLNRWSKKRITIAQGADLSAASGFVSALCRTDSRSVEINRRMAGLLREKGGPRAFEALPGDIGVMEQEKLLVVPEIRGESPSVICPELVLPVKWRNVAVIEDVVDGSRIARRRGESRFVNLRPGIYRMLAGQGKAARGRASTGEDRTRGRRN